MTTPPSHPQALERVNVYIDGYNLYYGIRDKYGRRYLWLDVWEFSRRLLRPGQELAGVKYFTTRISSPSDKVRRQVTYLEALEHLGRQLPLTTSIYFGHYLPKSKNCRQCGHTFRYHEEKKTDVNIATRLLKDAFLGEMDKAVVVSGDSDLVPPIETIHEMGLPVKVISAFPPRRVSFDLKQAADGFFTVSRTSLAAAQMPNEVPRGDGFVFRRPTSWA